MSTKREREMMDGIRLWTHQKEEALHEAVVVLIDEMDLTYEEVRQLRRKWESLVSNAEETSDDTEMFERLEELTHDWEESTYWKHGQEEPDEDEC